MFLFGVFFLFTGDCHKIGKLCCQQTLAFNYLSFQGQFFFVVYVFNIIGQLYDKLLIFYLLELLMFSF